MQLRNKKVLLIAPKYFGYEEFIKNALIDRDADVYLIYENLDEVDLYHRFIYVYMPCQKKKVLDDYYIKKVKSIGPEIDYVFAIRASSLSIDAVKFMKSFFSESCRYFMYQWDGIKNNPNVLAIADEFDQVLTFDYSDAKEYGWKYRPLFYINKLLKPEQRNIDVLYICSLHSKRVEVLNKLKDFCCSSGLNLHTHMFSKKLFYYKRKYLTKKSEYVNCDDKDVAFNSLSIEDSYLLYGKSRIVVDYTHPGQTGFTMRTIECLGNKCKLITNNEAVKTADFYNPRNIYVYSGTNVEIPEDFIKDSYEEIDPSLYHYYSLDGWFESIFGKES